MLELGGVAHQTRAVDGIAVAAPDVLAFEVAGLDEVGHDALGCALGDSDQLG